MSRPDAAAVLLDRSRADQAAAVLARALEDDPFQRHLLAERAGTPRFSTSLFRANIEIGLLYGEVYTTETLQGVAIWGSPEHADLTPRQLWKSGFLTASLSMGVTAFTKLIRAAVFVDTLKRRTISHPHWTLHVLGVDPTQQGSGIGGKLLRPVLSRADTTGTHCYLETTNERNQSFYRRHGFELAGNEVLPMGGPPIRIMVREPR